MTINDSIRLASLGWDATWATAFDAAVVALNAGVGTLSPARVVAEHRERYTVATRDGDRPAVLSGRFRHAATVRADLPAVGDWVGASLGANDGTTTINVVVPRRGAFIRRAAGEETDAQVVAANVDIALIATAVGGDLNTRRLERYLTLAWESGATPVVLLTKADLIDDISPVAAETTLAAPGVDVIAVSAVSGDGVDRLSALLVPGRTAVLLGSSGVGKSTLVNRLVGAELQRTSPIRDDGRGRHTTTHRELVRLANGALLIDTPGMRELQLWSADDGLDTAFADLQEFARQCRFRDCVHDREPGCAVREAVASGQLLAERLEHWHKLRRELAYLARKQDERATAEARGKIKGMMRGLRARLRDKYGGA